MISKNVYEHVKYGNGAVPKAWHQDKNGNGYGLSNRAGLVVARFYPPLPTTRDNASMQRWHRSVVDIPLSDIPKTVESDWYCYWENEC